MDKHGISLPLYDQSIFSMSLSSPRTTHLRVSMTVVSLSRSEKGVWFVIWWWRLGDLGTSLYGITALMEVDSRVLTWFLWDVASCAVLFFGLTCYRLSSIMNVLFVRSVKMGLVRWANPPALYFRMGRVAQNLKKIRPYLFGAVHQAYVFHGSGRAGQAGFKLAH